MSVAKVAPAHGINANIVHGRRELARCEEPAVLQQEFVPVGGMCGTSIATPIDAGVLARRLAADAAVLGMPRDSANAAATVKLTRDHAEN